MFRIPTVRVTPLKMAVFSIAILGMLTACAGGEKKPARFARPKILPRETWGASLVSGSFRSLRPNAITVLEQPYEIGEFEDSLLPTIYRIQEKHLNEFNWGDIGYHYIVLPTGQMYEGRRPIMKGHCEGWDDTEGHLIVAVMGRYDKRPLPPELQASLINLIGWLLVENKINPTEVYTLSDHIGGDNPGKYLNDFIHTGISEIIKTRYDYTTNPEGTHNKDLFKGKSKKDKERIKRIHGYSD